jgi:Aldo/keto reductase family
MAMATGYYGAQDDAEAFAALARALDLGVTLFDTANSYGDGKNEEFISPFLRPNRDRVVISTKFGIESIGAVSEFVKTGKVRFLALSEVTAAELREAHAIHPISALQPGKPCGQRRPDRGGSGSLRNGAAPRRRRLPLPGFTIIPRRSGCLSCLSRAPASRPVSRKMPAARPSFSTIRRSAHSTSLRRSSRASVAVRSDVPCSRSMERVNSCCDGAA